MFFLLANACVRMQPEYSLKDVPLIIDIKNTTGLRLDTVARKHIKYIPLETNTECLIGEVNKILIRNNRIFIADFHKTETLFVFDIQGNYLFKINSKGHGPGEYINFKDFDVFPTGDICIWDVDICKFLTFDSTGIFKHDLKMEDRGSFFCISSGNFYLSEVFDGGLMKANLIKYDIVRKESKNLIAKRTLYDANLVNYSYYKFYYSPGNIYYAPRFSEIIYSIDSTGLHPAVGLTNLPVPPDNILEQWNRQNTLMLDDTNYLKDIIYIYETERYISFQLETGSFFNLIYDKETQKPYRLDPIYKTTGMFYIQGSTGTHFVGTMLPDREYLADIMKQESLSGLTDNSNPVIVLLDFVL
jgi:hypothetical protein